MSNDPTKPRPAVTLFMAMSLNGMTARKNGKEDFLSHEHWRTFLALLKRHDGLIWGRRTFEVVQQWGTDYRVDIPLVVLSHKKMDITTPNVHDVTSPDEAIEYFRAQRKRRILLGGGSTTNTAFAQAGLVDEVMVNVEPTIVGEGIPLFAPDELDLRLSLRSIKKQKSGIITVRYSVMK